LTLRSAAVAFGEVGTTDSAIADRDGGIAPGMAAPFSTPKFMRRNAFSAPPLETAGQCSLGTRLATCDTTAATACLAGFGAV
jgi:hypothetical protein